MLMETGWFAGTTVALLEGDAVEELFGNSMSSILENPAWFFLAILVCFFWVIALIWVIKDAKARSYSFWFILLSALCVVILTPVFWIPLYVAIRPQWWRWDKTSWRDVNFLQVQICDNCGESNLIDNSCCVHCGEHLQTVCHECQKKYSKMYDYCPECWAPRLEV